ncbi:MarR family transcriptional regulator [Amycolatopsis circi]|uniref:MarR family transcriptional regulator n=1 Tax=Amycolatopsis circi TaxID=871959 RepID=UPI000E2430A0|nr:MarR family transcriptional regulator [Amycolatopsis circi]
MTVHSERHDDGYETPTPPLRRDLACLLDQPLALDVLTVLADQPATASMLCKQLRVRRSAVIEATRRLAACRLVRREDCGGSWDEPFRRQARYRLTAGGRGLVRGLDDLAVLVQLYRYYLGEPAADR